MKCPLLAGVHSKRCMAIRAVVSTSDSELGQYCESGRYGECPVYNNYLLSEEKTYNIAKEPTAGGEGPDKMSA